MINAATKTDATATLASNEKSRGVETPPHQQSNETSSPTEESVRTSIHAPCSLDPAWNMGPNQSKDIILPHFLQRDGTPVPPVPSCSEECNEICVLFHLIPSASNFTIHFAIPLIISISISKKV